jgi:hypothetical protein
VIETGTPVVDSAIVGIEMGRKAERADNVAWLREKSTDLFKRANVLKLKGSRESDLTSIYEAMELLADLADELERKP